ncbi:hypothetical protein DPMN_137345 [Dreissena polymorpha]|uniref:Uncharacterized protein n=1 Tax=Dreissena polymorpha TaxID=45954 RepID=A0A9D4JHK1_DREPO|nr:hypothetical protein DPMN_137345 [Dreissena polymorpha]
MANTCIDGEETSLCLLKNTGFLFTNTDRPVQLLAPGLSAARRDYFRDNVRPLLSSRGQEGFACRVRQNVTFLLF